nr:DNRLRE domain-containing protein [Microbispora rosea]GLJ83543.1 hypothetical protein GCM10017588_22710 [Microbispora rosea subsp. aerata]
MNRRRHASGLSFRTRRRAALIATAMLPLSLMSAPAVAQASTPPAPASNAASTTSPKAAPDPDLEAAWEKAAKSGRPVEVPSRFTEKMKVWAQPDGKHLRAELSTRPIQLKNPASGAWEPIDTKIVERDGKLQAARVKSPLTFGGRGAKHLVSAKGEKGTTGLKVTRALPEPKLSGSTITYPDAVAPGADLVVIAQGDGFISQVVFRRKPDGPVTVRLPLTLPAGTKFGKGPQGLPQLKDIEGKAVAAPVVLTAMDAKVEASPEQGRSSRVDAHVETSGTTSELVFTPDAEFLADPAVTYPVTIAASSEWFGGGKPADSWVSKNEPYSNHGADGWLRAGTTQTSADIARVYLKFDTEELWGATVVDADLIIWNYKSGGPNGALCGESLGSGIVVQRVTSEWSEGWVTWDEQPTRASETEGPNKAGYNYDASGTWCAKDEALWHQVTTMARAWIENGQTNYGMVLRAVNETATTNWRQYYSSEYGGGNPYPGYRHPPTLMVEYTPAREEIVAVWGMSPSNNSVSDIVEEGLASVPFQNPPAVPREQMDAAALEGDGYTETQPEVMTIPDGLTPEEVDEFLEGPRPTASPTPPSVVSTEPTAGQTGVGTNAQIKVTFSEPVVGEDITIKDAQGAAVAGSAVLEPGDTRLVFTPDQALARDTTYTAEVNGARNVMDATMSPYTWSFTTGQTESSPTPSPSPTHPPTSPTPSPSPTPPPTSTTISLPVRTDTWLDNEGWSGPDEETLWVGAYGYSTQRTIERSYLTFDTSVLLGKTITEAKLELWNSPESSYGCGDGNSGIKVQRITAPWNVATLRWGNQPSTTNIDEAVAKDSLECTDDEWAPSDVAWSWSVTGIVRAWASGQANYGLLLRGADESASAPIYDRGFESSEASGVGTSHPPVLKVTYVNGAGASPTPTATPTAGPDTVPPTVIRVQPEDEAENVPANTKVKVTFSEPVTDAQFYLLDIFTETDVPGTVSMSDNNTVLTFTPGVPLDSIYWAEVSEVKDAAGNTMTDPYGWLFSVGSLWLQNGQQSAATRAARDAKPSVAKMWTRSVKSKDGAVVTSTTPQLMVKASSPKKRPSTVEVEIAHDPKGRSQGTGLIWSGSARSSSSGTVGMVQVPKGVLKDGWEVRWRARVTAAGVSGGWSDWESFAIDTSGFGAGSTEQARLGALAATYSASNFKYDRIKDNDDCKANGRSAYGYVNKVLMNKKGYTRNRFSYCVTYMAGLVKFKYDKYGRVKKNIWGDPEYTDAVWFPMILIGRTYQGSRTIEFDLWVDDAIVTDGEIFKTANFTIGMTGTGYPNANACRGIASGSTRTSYTGNADYWDDRTVSFKFDSYVDAASAGPDNPELIGTCTTRTTIALAGLTGIRETQKHPEQSIRCDSAIYVGYQQGCIFDHEMPSIALKEALYPNAYSHISAAYLSPNSTHPNANDHVNAWPPDLPRTTPKNIPGFSKDNPIHRLYEPDGKRKSRNRGRSQSACRWSYYPSWNGKNPPSFPWVTQGLECDEFPFASTYEGAWVWWQENPPKDVRDYKPRGVNYSVKPIPEDENGKWGGRAQGGVLYYYAYDRMLDGDAFFIRLYDKTGKRINP